MAIGNRDVTMEITWHRLVRMRSDFSHREKQYSSNFDGHLERLGVPVTNVSIAGSTQIIASTEVTSVGS